MKPVDEISRLKNKQDKGVFRASTDTAELHRTAEPFGDLKRCYFF